jgi:hypothetical protein
MDVYVQTRARSEISDMVYNYAYSWKVFMKSFENTVTQLNFL